MRPEVPFERTLQIETERLKTIYKETVDRILEADDGLAMMCFEGARNERMHTAFDEYDFGTLGEWAVDNIINTDFNKWDSTVIRSFLEVLINKLERLGVSFEGNNPEF